MGGLLQVPGSCGRLSKRGETVVRRIIILKNAHVQNPRNCEYVTLRGKRDSAEVIKDLEMGRLNPGRPSLIT